LSFDKPTRNRLQNLVASCRRALQADIEDQLQSRYGMYRADERIQPLSELAALSFEDQDIAAQLRDLFSHYRAHEPDFTAAYDRLVHEIGFTSLNRLVSLRLAEERGYVVECVRKGLDSEGFRIYQLIVEDQLGTPFETYRFFLHLIFDEMAVDLHFLFDRNLAQGLVFPSELVLRKVLADLSAADLVPLWKEDETIGWVYQFFNDPEVRQRMRAESNAPRNSREMAVRNQFFTPRYVVEFLVDNTLGRIWIEMRQGKTGLRERCQYLLKRQNEIFLRQGEKPTADDPPADASKEQILELPFEVAFRAEKDPRDLKILDPASGSGHFLLYSFDLLEAIYREAWNDPSEAAPKNVRTANSLREDYGSLEELEKALPGLILANNLFGVDIDSRATQIAAVALWLRAQRAYQDAGLRSMAERPQITKMNLVVAEAMPSEPGLRQEFLDGLRPRVVAQVAERVFEVMRLAGEAGVLLRVEQALSETLSAARKQWEAEREVPEGLFPELEQTRTNLLFDVSDIDDDAFWEIAEETILEALSRFANAAESSDPLRRRLFANDSARGFAFIDLCRTSFDAVVMNPPFGEASTDTERLIGNRFSAWCGNLLGAFLMCGQTMAPAGFVGSITDRTWFQKTSYEELRLQVLRTSSVTSLIDLGAGVLDAQVEAGLTVLGTATSPKNICLVADIRHIPAEEKGQALETVIQPSAITPIRQHLFSIFPDSAFALSCPRGLITAFSSFEPLQPYTATTKRGISAGDTFRFYRTWWETTNSEKWTPLMNGGSSAFYRSCFWRSATNLGYRELAPLPGARLQNLDWMGVMGVTWAKRSDRIQTYPLPAGHHFTDEGQAMFPADGDSNGFLLALTNSAVFRWTLEMFCGQHKGNGYVNKIPVPHISKSDRDLLADKASQLSYRCMTIAVLHEDSPLFCLPLSLHNGGLLGLDDLDRRIAEFNLQSANDVADIDAIVTTCYGLSEDESRAAIGHSGVPYLPEFSDYSWVTTDRVREVAEIHASYLTGLTFGRWDIRFALLEGTAPTGFNPFSKLPVFPPGMLAGQSGLPSEESLSEYPLVVPHDGLLVDDSGDGPGQEHPSDFSVRFRRVLSVLHVTSAEDVEQTLCQGLKVTSLREYLCMPTGFFSDHLGRYSKSRRKAPIYWPLSTTSGSYTIWLYYPRLTEATLYTAIEDYVRPKLAAVERQRDSLEAQLRDNPLAPAAAREKLTQLRAFAHELIHLRDELLRVAALPYKPDLDDGVVINAAPLRKLFRYKPWVKELDEVWKKLEKGDYDWAHMALHLWTDRVRAKCVKDRSLAIAHGLESICTAPDPTKNGGQKRGSKKKEAALIEEDDE
jgi:hypothetical protein